MILLLESLRLKTQPAILELTEPIVEVFINRPRVNDLPGHPPIRRALLEVIHPGAHLDARQQSLDELIVTALRDALIPVIEIIVVKRITHRQTLDDERRQLRAAPAPLLLRIPLDELRVDIRADKRDRLLLKIPRLPRDRAALLCDDRLGLRRRHDIPEFPERIHIERQIVEMPLVIRDR